MDANAPRPSFVLRSLANGYQVTQAISVAANLGIADLLADGPLNSDELAQLTATHPDALYRLLRALASIGVLREEPGHRFALTDVGDCLRSDAPESLRGWAEFVGSRYHWEAWTGLNHSIRTGENAFRHVHGIDSWTFRARNPELSAAFDQAMVSLSRQASASVIAAYNFGRFGRIVDVGGGTGTFLAAVLARNPTTRGVLFDREHVVVGAPPILAMANVADRCDIAAGSFFESVPVGGDAYILKAIIHDWEDEDCIRILGTCRTAMAKGTTLCVIERLLGQPNEHPDGKFSDLNMLVGPGGRERTTDEYAALFSASSFQFTHLTQTEIGTGIFEAIAI